MKVLVFTNLFPNSLEPNNGIFNMYQVTHLAKYCQIRVVAPIPWTPLKIFRRNRCHDIEIISSIKVYHPKNIYIPKIARSLYGFLMFLSVFNYIKKLRQEFDFDVIYATWAYPDGFAAALISKILRKPFLLKVHGTDINEYIQYRLRRRIILYSLQAAKWVICVSNELQRKIEDLGIANEKIRTIYNGININEFKPINSMEARLRLSLSTKLRIILFVGNLIPVKGLDYLLDAFSILVSQYQESLFLILVGDGKLITHLKDRSAQLGLTTNVYFAGKRPHNEIPFWINACDVLCLPSLSEGLPNVIIESLACGRPVVATNIGGIPEVVKTGLNGILVNVADANMLADGLKDVLNKCWDPLLIRESIKDRSWCSNAQQIYDLLMKSIK